MPALPRLALLRDWKRRGLAVPIGAPAFDQRGGPWQKAQAGSISQKARDGKSQPTLEAGLVRETTVKLRDVLFLCHAKPKDAEQAETWKKLVENTLESPDTWEVALSAGKDRRETWERLLRKAKWAEWPYCATCG
jgi:hypothetical protein